MLGKSVISILSSDIMLRDKRAAVRNESFIRTLENGLNVIPFFPVGTIIKEAYTQISSYRDRRFAEKLEAFLFPISNGIVNNQFDAFWENIEEKKQSVAQYLIDLLDSVETDDKAEMMGHIYHAAVHGMINHDEMLRFCDIIRKCFIGDLMALPKFVEPNDEDTEAQILINLGLIDNFNGGIWKNDSKVSINELGEKFYNILCNEGYFCN